MLPTNPLLNATAPAGPHLPVALLRQYAAGTLAAAAEHRVEAHTLACPRCADILAGLLQSPPTTTDQALVQLQQRLRKRVQQQAAPARLAPRHPRWVALQLAAAAALLLGLVASGWWTWQQRHPTPSGVPEPMAMPMSLPAPATSPSVAPTTVPSVTAVAPAARQQPARPVVPTPGTALEAARGRAEALPARPAVAPVPTSGYPALREKLRREAAEFTPKAPGQRLSGTVQLRLTIGADGKVQQIKVLRGLRADYDAEAQRLVAEGPAWVPGISGGRRAVRVVEVAVPF